MLDAMKVIPLAGGLGTPISEESHLKLGGGDWAVDWRLPDAVRARGVGQALHGCHPEATRPWQHVIESLAAYLCLADRIWANPTRAGTYNFGPLPYEAATVRYVIKIVASACLKSASCYENNSENLYGAGWLALETGHARQALGVDPRWGLNTVDACALCLDAREAA